MLCLADDASLPVVFQYLRGVRPGGVLRGVLGGEERPADVSGEEDRGAGAGRGTVRYHDKHTHTHIQHNTTVHTHIAVGRDDCTDGFKGP